MDKNKVYWTMKNGIKIDIDDMTETHLKNTLKLIIKRNTKKNNNNVIPFSKTEIEALTKNPFCDDWMWK